ncbi:hypothetical protein [Pseudomonas putida]|uniref:hypothetical protein n=1 Tax=Pseudomonas putida TaxID=303 RepID=UPI002366D057|nr:hypothetical protein [Pseudomonas putida]MDD2050168.1 hypothetical protein [Pseudomonas putida]
MKKLGFPETPEYLPIPRKQPTKEEIQAIQDVGAAVAASNKKNELEANARWEAHLKKQQAALEEKLNPQFKGVRFRKVLRVTEWDNRSLQPRWFCTSRITEAIRHLCGVRHWLSGGRRKHSTTMDWWLRECSSPY